MHFSSRTRRGFTVFEMVLALSLLVLVLSLTVSVYVTQSRAVDRTSAQTEAQRSAMFASDQVDQELRNAGIGAVGGQPMLIFADGYTLAFNADVATARVNDPFAVFYDPDADSVAVGGLTTATAITVPGTTVSYPSVDYRSNAETIVYYVEPDTVSMGISLFRLMRRVNQREPEVVAPKLLKEAGQPLFRYFKDDPSGALTEFVGGSLPLSHGAPRHDSPADTGSSARADSVGLVTVRLVGVYRDSRGQISYDTVTRSIRIQNTGLLRNDQCGDAPLPITNLDVQPSGPNWVRIRWDASIDDLAGENDLRSYSIFRRPMGAPLTASEPIANLPASSSANYEYWDGGRQTGEQWIYSVVATDCTPAPSSVVAAPAITMP
jgi:type II secretory pathway pseudopilin PulG